MLVIARRPNRMAIEPPSSKTDSIFIRDAVAHVSNGERTIPFDSTSFPNPNDGTRGDKLRILKRWDPLFKEIEHQSSILSTLNP